MTRPLLILAGSLLLAYGVAFERSSTYEYDIRTVSKTVFYGTPSDMALVYKDGGAGEYDLVLKRSSYQTQPVGEHGQLTEHSKHKISIYFWQWFAGTFIVSAIVLNIVSKENAHE